MNVARLLARAAQVHPDRPALYHGTALLHDYQTLAARAARLAGELLGSGTVGGGCGNELGRFLKDGDVLELEVSGLGVLRNRIVAPHVPEPPPFPIHIPV
ncbi:MAG: fumarylacetoacetate hydrolase family protein [Pigmentiphaga sp.]|uniref:fumarylacetoacetate hydrolase family protein n=1 Tax=Pigmentiphaga sp. TaxID=1977564 RepID=UPI0029A9C3BF|nr:fumarylacetoacetate hydrolase family protein [Pigmentiphaga sp.]MDX3904980.1 fumarylacetoacetate hydrolase family protein [Pigmentiphaga sp.]